MPAIWSESESDSEMPKMNEPNSTQSAARGRASP